MQINALSMFPNEEVKAMTTTPGVTLMEILNWQTLAITSL